MAYRLKKLKSSALATAIRKKTGMSGPQSAAALRAMIDEMIQALLDGYAVALPGLGMFHLAKGRTPFRMASEGNNAIVQRPMARLSVKCGKTLRRRALDEWAGPQIDYPENDCGAETYPSDPE